MWARECGRAYHYRQEEEEGARITGDPSGTIWDELREQKPLANS